MEASIACSREPDPQGHAQMKKPLKNQGLKYLWDDPKALASLKRSASEV